MDLSFVLHALGFIGTSAAVLSVGQAWALVEPPHRTRHMLVWAAGFALMLWLGLGVLGLHWSDPIMREGPLRRSVVTVSAALAAASLGAGVAWAKSHGMAAEPFSRRVLGLAQAHLAMVAIGGALAYVLIAIIWISQLH